MRLDFTRTTVAPASNHFLIIVVALWQLLHLELRTVGSLLFFRFVRYGTGRF